jgi:hypothetical protein
LSGRRWGFGSSLVVLCVGLCFVACGAVDAGAGDANVDVNADARVDAGVEVGGEAGVEVGANAEPSRPRIVVETSGAPGELLALGRLLFYADELDVRGIVVTDAGSAARARLEALFSAYEQTRPTLQRFGAYPEAASLRAVTKTDANVNVGSPAEATAVAALLSAALADGAALTWLGFSPGAPALRRALDQLLATTAPEAARTQTARLRLHGVAVNDGLGPHTGELAQVLDFGPQSLADARATSVWSAIGGDEFIRAGALGAHLAALSPSPATAPPPEPATSESEVGAGAAWLTVLPVLPGSPTAPSQPTWGSWGGRFVPSPRGLSNLFVPATNDVWLNVIGEAASVARFAPAVLADFRARLTRASAAVVNRPPIPEVRITDASGRVLSPIAGAGAVMGAGASGTPSSLVYEVPAGAILTLDASASTDPDGHAFSVTWSLHNEASRFPGDVTLHSEPGPRATLEIPVRLAEQQNVHVLCEITDAGAPPLIRHRRLVLQRSR